MGFIKYVLSCFKNKEAQQKTPNTISSIIWEVGFNLTEEQMKQCRFKAFYEPIPELTVESIGGIPNVGEYLTFKHLIGTDKYGLEDFLFVRIKITRVERVVAGEASSFYADISGDVVTIHDRSYAKILDLENNAKHVTLVR